jgi:glycerate dehydrogenase
MKAVFLDLDTVGPGDLDFEKLNSLPVSWVYHEATSESEAAARIADADIVITNKSVLGQQALQAARQLQYISAAATGFNHIDIAAAEELGIPVSNVRDYATPSVVQHVYALVLALSTHLLDYNAAVRRGEWQTSDFFCLLDYPIDELAGKKLGIIGYGTLGHAVAQVAPAFGMEVLIGQHLHGEPDPERLGLDDLLAAADIISLHLPLNKRTRNLIGERELSLMKKNALLINTGRGGLVNEQALADALRSGQIAGAGFDVLSKEPPEAGNPLLAADIPNLIVTPHTAWASRQSRQRLLDQIAHNIQSFLDGSTANRVDV